jgi:hypothetical protein
MISRCHNPSHYAYKSYGARGIYVCDQWRYSFDTFLSDMGLPPEGMTLERVNNDGPYTPDNCCWASMAEQVWNRRITVRLTHNGESLTLRQWSDRIGIPIQVLQDRNKRGWSASELLTTPYDRAKWQFQRDWNRNWRVELASKGGGKVA